MSALTLADLRELAIPAGSAVVAYFVLVSIRAFTVRWISASDERVGLGMGEATARLLRGPSLFWCVAIAVHVGLSVSDMPERYAGPLRTLIQILVIVSVTLVVANVLESVVHRGLTSLDQSLPESGLLRVSLRGSVFVVGGLAILARLGVHIGPMLTALGVGGIAVGLALQDTLGNLFAGIGLLLDRAIRVGDHLRLEGGQEGQVEDIGWRTTKIRLLSGDQLVVPNTKLAQNIATRLVKGG